MADARDGEALVETMMGGTLQDRPNSWSGSA